MVIGTLNSNPSGCMLTPKRAIPFPRFVVSSNDVPVSSVMDSDVYSFNAPGGTSMVTLPSGVEMVPPSTGSMEPPADLS